jgi:hypothetical protein
MDLYLPIAGVSVNAVLLAALGVLVGLVSGLLGIGGGFLLTPLLVFMGIPPSAAAASATCHIVSSSASGLMAKGRQRYFDTRMGLVLAVGGVAGATIGVEAVKWLGARGAADAAVSVAYVAFLLSIGGAMLVESLAAMHRQRLGLPTPDRPKRTLIHAFPVRIRFPTSRLYISVLPPLVLGMVSGILAALMGVGGGFILVPALIYLIRMPARLAAGTASLQILLIAGLTAVLQAGRNQTLDVMMIGVLVLGGSVGAQLGARFAFRARAEQLRLVLAGLILLVAARLVFSMVVPPADVFTLMGGGL